MEKLKRINEFYKDGDGHDPAAIGDKLWKDVGNNLNVLSDRGWLHLDVHRGNIMATNKGEFILIDFGLAVKKTKSGDQTYPHHKYSRDFPNITWDQLKIYQNFQFQVNYNAWSEKEMTVTGYSRGNYTEDKKKIYKEATEIWGEEEKKIIQENRKRIEEITRQREEEAIRRQIKEARKRELEEDKPITKKSK